MGRVIRESFVLCIFLAGPRKIEIDSRVCVSPEFSQRGEFLQTQKRRMRRVRRRGLRSFLYRL